LCGDRRLASLKSHFWPRQRIVGSRAKRPFAADFSAHANRLGSSITQNLSLLPLLTPGFLSDVFALDRCTD
jgi:hypothetical protein